MPVLSATQDRGMILRDDSEKLVIHDIRNEVGYKRVVPGQFVIHLRSFQGGFAHSAVEGITSPAYTVMEFKEPEKHNDYFWKFVFSSREFVNRLRVVTYGIRDGRSISYEDFLRLPFNFPSVEEQASIASFIKLMGEQIANLTDKITSLKSLKICYLSRLFPIGGGYEPSIRLSSFSGKWEVKKLKDFTKRIVRKNTALESDRTLTISAQYGLIEQESFFNSRIASSNLSNYYLVKKGEFAYNKSTSQGYPYGAVKRLDLYDKGVLSTLYIVFELDEEQVDSDYLVSYFETTAWHEQIRMRAAEGARNHGLLNISADDFFDIDILVPKKKEEQKAIGNYFVQLNELINLHSDELERLKALKQSGLQGMFV